MSEAIETMSNEIASHDAESMTLSTQDRKREKKKRHRARVQAKRQAEVASEQAELFSQLEANRARKRPREENESSKASIGASILQTFAQLGGHGNKAFTANSSRNENDIPDVADDAQSTPSEDESTNSEKTMPTIEMDLKSWNVPRQIADNIHNHLGIETFFPMQREAIRKILSCTNDICISSPTGSGKTLAFAIPVVADLMQRIIRRLRALILLPTRELAIQCFETFKSLTSGTILSVACTTGHIAVAESKSDVQNCDILVSTPGRLVDHVVSTEAFTLEYLSYFVVDEADRLLSQNYQNWLENMNTWAFKQRCGRIKRGNDYAVKIDFTNNRCPSREVMQSLKHPEVSMRKILCSATLTRNPEKLAALDLKLPVFVEFSSTHHEKVENVDARFSLPSSLVMNIMVCEPTYKPLALIQILMQLNDKPSLIFVASVEAAHRLAIVLELYLGSKVREFSSGISQSRRNVILRDFREGKFPFLVVSDVMARGLDLKNLVNVVNYDMPLFTKGFVHRVGRVARAGKSGNSFSLLRPDQVNHFTLMMDKLSFKGMTNKLRFSRDDASSKESDFEKCMSRMKEIVTNEAKRVR